jgi:hypothetical protein
MRPPRRGLGCLAAACVIMLPAMFVVTEADAAAIRAAYEQEGELSAAIEVRRLWRGSNQGNTRNAETLGWRGFGEIQCNL